MATQSKMIFDTFSSVIMQALFGSNKKKIVSFSILIIIGFLVHIKRKRTHFKSMKFSKLSMKDKDVVQS